VAESATANVFMVRDGLIRTSVPNGTFLNGVTRQRIIGLLKGAGHDVDAATPGFDDFLQADEVFMTGNISKVTPVTRFEDRAYGIGPVTKLVRQLYWDWARS
jgi:branched-chain amino acid aminotransferase